MPITQRVGVQGCKQVFELGTWSLGHGSSELEDRGLRSAGIYESLKPWGSNSSKQILFICFRPQRRYYLSTRSPRESWYSPCPPLYLLPCYFCAEPGLRLTRLSSTVRAPTNAPPRAHAQDPHPLRRACTCNICVPSPSTYQPGCFHYCRLSRKTWGNQKYGLFGLYGITIGAQKHKKQTKICC